MWAINYSTIMNFNRSQNDKCKYTNRNYFSAIYDLLHCIWFYLWCGDLNCVGGVSKVCHKKLSLQIFVCKENPSLQVIIQSYVLGIWHEEYNGNKIWTPCVEILWEICFKISCTIEFINCMFVDRQMGCTVIDKERFQQNLNCSYIAFPSFASHKSVGQMYLL